MNEKNHYTSNKHFLFLLFIEIKNYNVTKSVRELSPQEEELAERSKKGKSIVHFLKLK